MGCKCWFSGFEFDAVFCRMSGPGSRIWSSAYGLGFRASVACLQMLFRELRGLWLRVGRSRMQSDPHTGLITPEAAWCFFCFPSMHAIEDASQPSVNRVSRTRNPSKNTMQRFNLAISLFASIEQLYRGDMSTSMRRDGVVLEGCQSCCLASRAWGLGI